MKRNVQLDFLRFIGVFLVMVAHMYIISNKTFLDKFFLVIHVGGWTGVDLFFVLSGYLVSGLIMKELKLYGSFNATRFLIRRGFKIYPTYYLYIIFIFIMGKFIPGLHHQPTLTGLFHESIFVTNYFSFNSVHLWSLSVEEHFYFVLAILFLILIRYKKVNLKVFILIYVFLLIEGIGFRLYNYLHSTGYDFSKQYTKSHFRFDSLFFGVLIAYMVNYHLDIINSIVNYRYRIIFILLSVGVLSTNFIFERADYPFIAVSNLALNPICYGYLMLVVINIKNEIFVKIITPLAYIGMYSYSLYLFHFFFNNVSIHFIKQGGYWYYLAYFSTAVIGGIVISKCVEYPLINIREKYFPSRSRAKKSQPAFEKGF